MKSWRKTLTCSAAVAAAAVAIPLSAGTASAASRQTIGGGPAVFSNLGECEEYGKDMKDRGEYEDYRCYEEPEGIYTDALK